jgi:hypothetical protein
MTADATQNDPPRRREFLLIASTWLALAMSVFLLARQNLREFGLYYDEAVFGGIRADIRAWPNAACLEAARNSAVPVKIEPYLDREGQIAFYTIQFQSR